MNRIPQSLKLGLSLLLSLHFFQSASANSNLLCAEVFHSKTDKTELEVQISPAAHNIKTYSHGFISARTILRLSADEYERAVALEQIPPDVVLLLDRLPLHLDLPKVQGVLISTPLAAEGSHIQYQAEIMDIPLLYSPTFFKDPKLIEIANKKLFVEINSKSDFLISASSHPFSKSTESKPLAHLPSSTDRRPMTIYSARNFVHQPLELVGAKFKPLAELQALGFERLVPKVFSLSPGFYEHFLSQARIQNQSLRNFIDQNLREIKATSRPERVRTLLSEIRTAIEQAELPSFFIDLCDRLQNLGLATHRPYSIRSNNEIEDHIGAGVFNSAVIGELTPATLATALKKVWTSMYTLRSFEIRRAWNLNEDHLSMPILFHEYVGQERLNATASVFWTGASFQMKINGVIGNQSKATNPGAQAETFKLEIRERGGRPYLVQLEKNSNPSLPRAEAEQILNLFRILRPKLLSDFTMLSTPSSSIDLEFILDSKSQPLVLQYKRRLPREAVISLMRGSLELNALDNKIITASTPEAAAVLNTLARNGIKFLQASALDHGDNSVDDSLDRCAVIQLFGEYRMVVWENIQHRPFQEKLKKISQDIRWISGGYITQNSDGSLTLRPEVFPGLFRDFSNYHKEIRLALENESRNDPALFRGIPNIAIQNRYRETTRIIELPLIPKKSSSSRLRKFFQNLNF